MILFLDFEKAFDSLESDYLFKVLDIMNFGPSFLNWIHTFYKNISSCVINNGYSSDFFALRRGVRQRCPLSGLLFFLAVEPLAHQIRISECIKSLENGSKSTKLSLYADDTAAFIRDDLLASSLFDLLDQFGELSGLKRNKSKLGKQGWCSGESARLPPMWPGFDSRTRCHKWVEFLLVLFSASRVFLRVLRFSSLAKNQHTADSSWL